MVIQLSVKEAIVPTSSATGATNRDIDLAKVRALLDRCGIVVTERKPSEPDWFLIGQSADGRLR